MCAALPPTSQGSSMFGCTCCPRCSFMFQMFQAIWQFMFMLWSKCKCFESPKRFNNTICEHVKHCEKVKSTMCSGIIFEVFWRRLWSICPLHMTMCVVDLPPAHFKVRGRFGPGTCQGVWLLCCPLYTFAPYTHSQVCGRSAPYTQVVRCFTETPHMCIYIVFYEIKHCLEDPKFLLTHQ